MLVQHSYARKYMITCNIRQRMLHVMHYLLLYNHHDQESGTSRIC